MNSDQARIVDIHDQSFALLAEHRPSIHRIAEHGPSETLRDRLICKLMANMVAGDLLLLELTREE